ncbi:DUF3093 domain-containing protein [Brachybacterium huguangmaarense]
MPAPSVPTPAAQTAAQTSARTTAEPLFRERLTPSPAVWIVAAATGALFGIILVPLSTLAAMIVAPLMAVGACVLLAMTSPVVEIRPDLVAVGPARIEPELLGAPEVLEGEDWARTMGTGFEPLAHHCVRGWIRGGVRLPVLDRQDPTTAWVVSSRRPEELALAVRAAQAGA